MPNIIKLDAEINFDDIQKTIDGALKLEDNQEVFYALTDVMRVKEQVKILLEKVESVERDTKGLINSRAKQLYGEDWQVIKGEHFKITRSKTGDVYLINGKPLGRYTKTKITVDSKAVDEYVAKNEKLPLGIEINDQRGESLRITLK